MLIIPHFKRDKFIFISNLGNITANPNHPITFKRDGYLLSEHLSNSTLVNLAHLAKKKRNLLVSDNGSFSRMKAISSNFEEAGKSLLNLAEEEFENQGKISQTTMLKRESLINEIAIASENSLNSLDLGRVIERQVEIKPDYLIGLEDFTIPILMMNGLMNSLFKPNAKDIKIFQKKTNTLYSNQVAGKFGHKQSLNETFKFLVLHGYDYTSTFQGAEQLSILNPDGIAISYGAPLRSRQFISSINFGENIELFSEKLPESYILSTAITMGAVHALKSDTPIHILGVGSPILIALIGQLLHHSRAVSIDSTAPFKDSNIGKIYGSRYAFLKMDMYKLAAYSLINNTPYSSSTPYFRNFEKDFPSNWSAMRVELGVISSTSVKDLVEQLKSVPALVEKHIPFFSKMQSGNDTMINQLRMDRAGHNFWILRNICVSIRKKIGDHNKMEKWMQYQVDRYKSIGSKKWIKAVDVAFQFSKIHQH